MQAIVLIDHGSRRSEANAQLEQLAERVRAQRGGTMVVTAHLEIEPPTLGEAIDACVSSGATHIVVHPFFLLPGRHTGEHVPQLVEAARAKHPAIEIALSEPLGLDEAVVDLVLRRIDDAR